MNYLKNIIVVFSLLIICSNTYALENQQKIDFDKASHLLQLEENYSKWWQYGFLGLFSAGAALNLGIFLTTDEDDKKFDSRVDFIKSTLGAADLLLNPMVSYRGPKSHPVRLF